MAVVLHVERDYLAMSRHGAVAVRDSLRRLAADTVERPLNVTFSAGRTPTQLYAILASQMRDQVDWSRVALFQMDEYVDAPSAVEPFKSYLARTVVAPLEIVDWRPLEVDKEANDETWREVIAHHELELAERGGIDLAVHGIGANGHLGFNEPGSPPSSTGRVVELSSSTRAAMAQPPATMGVTMGLTTLLSARETILLASGAGKALAVAAAIEGPLSADCPASWLRLWLEDNRDRRQRGRCSIAAWGFLSASFHFPFPNAI